jgi:hypothetical protein
MRINFGFVVLLYITVNMQILHAQQVADTSYKPVIKHPAYQPGKGQKIHIDQAHANFHTRTGRYLPFAKILERDGYIVEDFNNEFTAQTLRGCKILVISNAIHQQNKDAWANPILSAFSKAEIIHLFNWVKNGGSLFLIADHMPFGGAASELAAAFGIEFQNGFAYNAKSESIDYFNYADSTLLESPLVNGRFEDEMVNHVASFTGQVFPCPEGFTPIGKMTKGSYQLYPDTAWKFNEQTRIVPTDYWCQLAYSRYGQGKIVISGEAAMFSAQLAGPTQIKSGMNSATASENYQLLLNIIHWLDGLIVN